MATTKTETVTGGGSTATINNPDGSTTTTKYDINGKVLSSSTTPIPSGQTFTDGTNATIVYGVDYGKSTNGGWCVFDNEVKVVCHVNGCDPIDIVSEWKYLNSAKHRAWYARAGYTPGLWTDTNKNGVELSPISDIPDNMKKLATGITQPDPEKGKIVKEEVKIVTKTDAEGVKSNGVVKTTTLEGSDGKKTVVVVNTLAGTKTVAKQTSGSGLAGLISLINAIGTVSSIIAGIKSFATSVGGGASSNSGSLGTSSYEGGPSQFLAIITTNDGQSYLIDKNDLPPETVAKLEQAEAAVNDCNYRPEDCCPTDPNTPTISSTYDPGCSLIDYTGSDSPGGSLVGALSLFNSAKNIGDTLNAIDSFISAMDYSTLEPHAGEGDNGKSSFANCIPKIPSFASLLSKLGTIDIPKIPELPKLPGIPSMDDALGFIGDLLPTLPKIPTLPEISKMLGLDNLKCPPGPEDTDKDKVSIFKAFDEAQKAKSTFDSLKNGDVAMNVIGLLMAQQCTSDTGKGRIDPVTKKPIFDKTPEKIKSTCVNNMETLKKLKDDVATVEKLVQIVGNAKGDPMQALVNYDLLQKNQYAYLNNEPYKPSELQMAADAIGYAEDATCIFGSFAENPLQALVDYEKLQTKQAQEVEADKIRFGL